MKKAILTILAFCFVAFTATAQVEKTDKPADAQKSAVEKSKIEQERLAKERAAKANQTNPQVDNPNAPVIEFDKKVHDYGTIAKGDDGNCEFTFTNKGREPLILSNVRAS